jgi:hypothetical protein
MVSVLVMPFHDCPRNILIRSASKRGPPSMSIFHDPFEEITMRFVFG